MKIIASALVAICLLVLVLFSYYGRRGTPPIQVANAIITCAQTVCEARATSPACAQLTAAITGCLSSGINAAVCLGGVPALVNVGYADVVCVVAALASAPPKPIAYHEISKSVDLPWNKSVDMPGNESVEIHDQIPDVRQQAIEWLKTQQIVVKP